MSVPFLDLKTQYKTIQSEITSALQNVSDSAAFAGGPFVEKFEKEFASFCQSEFAVGVGSGTDALWVTLMCLGIGKGDEVITTPNTFIATAEAITFCGAKPMFVDIDEQTYNMDFELLKGVITTKTKAIIPVHLFGQPADMDPIIKIAQEYGLFVIEDACQAHGAEYKGRRAGSIGHAGCFSFYPGKNLGAYGEAGAVVTNSAELAEKIKRFRDHGQVKKYFHSMIGWNARMDGFQGAVLSVKLKHLSAWNEARIKNAKLYNELLADIDKVKTPIEADYAKHIYHIYAIRTKNRNALMSSLAEKNISCGIHYPIPLHIQEVYRFLGYGLGSFPVVEKCAEEFLSLPMFPELTGDQIKVVVKEIKYFFAK